jgi:CheY-like chemotaxis protein
MRVLYVDDEPDIREVARMSLELDSQFIVEVAGSGLEALNAASKFRPDVVLLDVMMPDMDGPTTLAALKQAHGDTLPPVIFVTARTQAREVERFRTLGACAVIPKPFDPMTLAQHIRELVT